MAESKTAAKQEAPEAKKRGRAEKKDASKAATARPWWWASSRSSGRPRQDAQQPGRGGVQARRPGAHLPREIARAHAESELAKYRIVQDRPFESDFDRVVAETKRLAEKTDPPKSRRKKERKKP